MAPSTTSTVGDKDLLEGVVAATTVGVMLVAIVAALVTAGSTRTSSARMTTNASPLLKGALCAKCASRGVIVLLTSGTAMTRTTHIVACASAAYNVNTNCIPTLGQ